MGLHPALALSLGQSGELQPAGGFVPDDDEEDLEKRFYHNPLWGKELGEALVKEMVFCQIALKKLPKKETGVLLNLLLNALRDQEYDKNLPFH